MNAAQRSSQTRRTLSYTSVVHTVNDESEPPWMSFRSDPSSPVIDTKTDNLAPQWPYSFPAAKVVEFFEDCEKRPHIPVKMIFGNHFPEESFNRPTCNEERVKWRKVKELLRHTTFKILASFRGAWSSFLRKLLKLCGHPL